MPHMDFAIHLGDLIPAAVGLYLLFERSRAVPKLEVAIAELRQQIQELRSSIARMEGAFEIYAEHRMRRDTKGL